MTSKMTMVVVMLALVALFGGMAVSSASADMDNNLDMGDIRVGYDTSHYTNPYDGTVTADLYATVSGYHKVDNSSVSITPNYQPIWDDNGNYVGRTRDGYIVSEFFSGRIIPLTDADVSNQYQSNSFNARGLGINENTNIDCFNQNTDSGVQLYTYSAAEISILNFQVTRANGQYNEYTYTNGGGDDGGKGAMPVGVAPLAGIDPGTTSVTYFNYNVTWYGDFLPGALSDGMVAPAMGAAVPEPATMGLLIFGLGGLVARRRKRK